MDRAKPSAKDRRIDFLPISWLALLVPPWPFPVQLRLGGQTIPIHLVTDLLAYSLGFQLYLRLKKRVGGARLSWEQQGWVLVGCIFGALFGAKLLAWAENPDFYWALRHDPHFWESGKTIVGGLLGGWAGIEIAKYFLKIGPPLGDAIVYPLIVGMSLGRIGCFLTGLPDQTYGTITTVPWAIDFGDGQGRHPTQLYEIVFLIGWGIALARQRRVWRTPGLAFRLFLAGYMGFRFCVDFIKPHAILWAGLDAIQWSCLGGILVALLSICRLKPAPGAPHV